MKQPASGAECSGAATAGGSGSAVQAGIAHHRKSVTRMHAALREGRMDAPGGQSHKGLPRPQGLAMSHKRACRNASIARRRSPSQSCSRAARFPRPVALPNPARLAARSSSRLMILGDAACPRMIAPARGDCRCGTSSSLAQARAGSGSPWRPPAAATREGRPCRALMEAGSHACCPQGPPWRQWRRPVPVCPCRRRQAARSLPRQCPVTWRGLLPIRSTTLPLSRASPQVDQQQPVAAWRLPARGHSTSTPGAAAAAP